MSLRDLGLLADTVSVTATSPWCLMSIVSAGSKHGFFSDNMYTCNVHACLANCNHIWTREQQSPLFGQHWIIQIATATYAYGVYPRTSCREYFTECCCRVVTRTKETDHIMIYHTCPQASSLAACTKGHWSQRAFSCAQLQELVPWHAPSHGLRFSSKLLLRVLSVDRHKKRSFGANPFESAAPQLWNSLPRTLRDSTSKNCSRDSLRHVFDHWLSDWWLFFLPVVSLFSPFSEYTEHAAIAWSDCAVQLTIHHDQH